MVGHKLGFEKEPKTDNGPRSGGKHPPVHSHSKMPRRKVMPKGAGKRMVK